MQFYNFIIDLAKNNSINVFVDMDGVIAEYKNNQENDVKNNTPNIFLNKRPLFNIIEIIEKINNLSNVKLYILSLCNYQEQKKEKNLWLDKYANFINEDNRIIIVKNEEVLDNTNSLTLKSKYIKTITNDFKNTFIIDDDHRILKETKKQIPEINIIHISMLIN